LVGLQLSVSPGLSDHHAPTDGLRIADKIAKDREAVEARLIGFLDDESRLLKFYREEEGRTGVNALRLAATCVQPAGVDVVNPEGKPGRVWRAVEKVDVMLPHKEIGRINGIRGRSNSVIVDNGDNDRRGPGDLRAR